ncbi:hypothetical protein D3C80_1311920 [compost metagenome]
MRGSNGLIIDEYGFHQDLGEADRTGPFPQGIHRWIGGVATHRQTVGIELQRATGGLMQGGKGQRLVGGRGEGADERAEVGLAGRRQLQAQVVDAAAGCVGSDFAALHLVGVLVAEAGAGDACDRFEILEVGAEHFTIEDLGNSGVGLGDHRQASQGQGRADSQQCTRFHLNIL